VDTSNSRVGVGTTAPSSTFSVGSSNNFTVDSTGNLTTSGTTGLTFSSTGGVSLSGGTISDTSDGVDIADDLEVSGSTTLGDNSDDSLTINAATLSLANAATLDLANSQTRALNIEGGLLNLDSSNTRVGIGTTAPSATLDVSGTIKVGTTNASGSAHLCLDANSIISGCAVGSGVDGTMFLSGPILILFPPQPSGTPTQEWEWGPPLPVTPLTSTVPLLPAVTLL